MFPQCESRYLNLQLTDYHLLLGVVRVNFEFILGLDNVMVDIMVIVYATNMFD